MTLIKWQEDGDRITLAMPADLDLAMSAPLVDSLRHAVAVGREIRVEAAGVERVSSACLQALYAATRHAADHGISLVIQEPSETVRAVCDDLGLAEWLNIWSQS